MATQYTPSDTPLTPPLTEEGWLDWLRLLRSRRVGPSTFYRLLAEEGSAGAALEALPKIAAAAGVEDYSTADPSGIAREWEAAARIGARPLAPGMSEYPTLLLETPDAPPFLWALGDTGLLARPMTAVVGARNASSLGLRMARRLASGLGEAGHVVVSGMARGIDTAAHEAALGSGTVAVLAGGVDVVYPPENAVIAQEIAESGLRLSEMPLHFTPRARHFPQRNRIIAGMSSALVVVEAAAKSGSLITARNALDLGREVLAVPGHPFDARASGCNMLIRDGATLVRGSADVLDAIVVPVAAAPARSRSARVPDAPPERSPAERAALHAEILGRLGAAPTEESDLIRDLRRPASEVAPEITELELAGRIGRTAGGLLSTKA